MKYLQYTPYLYLLIAIFFVIEAVTNWTDANNEHFVFLAIAAVCVFMFFFRRRFANKMADRNHKS